jgi:hypothetical protein
MPFKRDGENQPKEVWQLAGCKVQNPTKWIPILKERVRNKYSTLSKWKDFFNRKCISLTMVEHSFDRRFRFKNMSGVNAIQMV